MSKAQPISSAQYQLHHKTVYQYQFPVSLSHHSAHLQPRNYASQSVKEFRLKIHPDHQYINKRTDFFGNSVHFFSVESPHETLVVESFSKVTVEKPELPDPLTSPTCAEVREYLSTGGNSAHQTADIQQFLFPSESIPYLPSAKMYASPYFSDDSNFLVACCRLALDIFDEFEFSSSATDVSTPLEKVLELKKGVCQDFAHLMIACLRSCNLPARYVSGYILTEPPEGRERLIGADASHAWVSVFIPHFGWVDIDPTNAQLCGIDYISVAYGRDFHDVSPVKGSVLGGGDQKLSIAVTMAPESEHSLADSKIPLFL